VLYPGEGHGNLRAASRYDYQLRSLAWLEHYLKGSGGPPPAFEVDYEPAKPGTATTSGSATGTGTSTPSERGGVSSR
jgi:hypothetical protein